MISVLSIWLLSLGSAQAILSTPEPGTVFVFSQGRVERFVRRDGERRIWATRSGREYIRAANPAIPVLSWQVGEQTGSRQVLGRADAIWPPAPGLKTRFRVLTRIETNGVKRRIAELWRCEVRDAETLTIATVRFTTLPIECTRFSTTSMRPLQRRTWWWAPDVGHYVHREFANMRTGETLTVTLCAALPAYRATQQRINQLVKEDCLLDS